MSLGVRHVAKRRKKTVRTKRPAVTHTSIVKETLDLLIYPVAFLGPLALVPQVIKLYASQDPSGLALSTWLILGLFNLTWLYYGYVHKEQPIVITNLILAVCNFAIVFGILAFR